MKKQCRILMIEKMKPFMNLRVIVLLVLLAFLNTGCYTYPATLAPSEENLRSKQLTPPAGKALVYFYLNRGEYVWYDMAASLNGIKSRISENTYVLWEVFPGEYLLTFDQGKLEIQCEANQIYYYCVSSKSSFVIEKLGRANDATGKAKISEYSLVKWFKDVPAPLKAKVTSGEEVAVDVAEPAEPEKAEVPAQVPPDEAIAILEVKIDKVSDESTTFYDPMGRPIATVPRCVFSPGEHIRSSLTQAKFRIASDDMKETPDATLAVRYQEKSKRLGLGSPKTFFLSYELIHRTQGKLFEGGVGPQGCDTQEQFENHPQFRDIGLLIRDAFIRSEVKAAATEAIGSESETTEAEEAVSTTQQAGDPNTDSASTESTQLGEKSESTTVVIPVPRTPTPVPFAIRNPKFEAAYKGECDTDATIISVEGDSFGAGGQISIRNGALALWCYGAKHTWKGKLTYADHVFDSDNESPLQFRVDKDKGYVYLGGKGTVTLPDGTAITLPVEHTDVSAVAPGTISGALSEEKRGNVPTARQASDPNTDSDRVDKQESDEKNVEPSPQESGETDKPQPAAEVIGTIRLIMQKDSDVKVTTFQNGIMTGSRDRFEYEPDADIKASLEQMEFEVIPEDSNRPEDTTLVVHYEEKKRGVGLDSPTAYYFSFSLRHKTKGTLLEGSAKATGCDSAEELRNHPQFQDIGLLIKDAFIRSEVKAAAAEATGNETAEAEEAVSTAQQAGDPNTDSDGVDAERSKSSKQVRISFSKEHVVKVDGISGLVGMGKASFEMGEDPNIIRVEITNKVKIIDDKSTCMFAVETILIAPHVKVPVSLFIQKDLGEHSGMKTLRKSEMKIHYALETVKTQDGRQYKIMKKPPVRETLEINGLFSVRLKVEDERFLLAGPDGASLKKVDDGFILLDGEAYIISTARARVGEEGLDVRDGEETSIHIVTNGVQPLSETTATASANAKIAFTSTRDGNSEDQQVSDADTEADIRSSTTSPSLVRSYEFELRINEQASTLLAGLEEQAVVRGPDGSILERYTKKYGHQYYMEYDGSFLEAATQNTHVWTDAGKEVLVTERTLFDARENPTRIDIGRPDDDRVGADHSVVVLGTKFHGDFFSKLTYEQYIFVDGQLQKHSPSQEGELGSAFGKVRNINVVFSKDFNKITVLPKTYIAKPVKKDKMEVIEVGFTVLRLKEVQGCFPYCIARVESPLSKNLKAVLYYIEDKRDYSKELMLIYRTIPQELRKVFKSLDRGN